MWPVSDALLTLLLGLWSCLLPSNRRGCERCSQRPCGGASSELGGDSAEKEAGSVVTLYSASAAPAQLSEWVRPLGFGWKTLLLQTAGWAPSWNTELGQKPSCCTGLSLTVSFRYRCWTIVQYHHLLTNSKLLKSLFYTSEEFCLHNSETQ